MKALEISNGSICSQISLMYMKVSVFSVSSIFEYMWHMGVGL